MENKSQLFTALLTVQKSIKEAVKSAENPHFKSMYATYEEIIKVAKEPLNNNGFFLSHKVCTVEGFSSLETILQHVSGEVWSSGMLKLELGERVNMQSLGAAITYGKRQQLAALLAIPCEEDDDGNSVSRETYKNTPPQYKVDDVGKTMFKYPPFEGLTIQEVWDTKKDELLKFHKSTKNAFLLDKIGKFLSIQPGSTEQLPF